MEEHSFKLRKIITEASTEQGVRIDPDRVKLEEQARILRATLYLATQEEPLYRHPSNWRYALKERFFPAWLKRKTPVKYTEVIAIHKFPEMQGFPVGREFVHLVVMDYDEFERRVKEGRIPKQSSYQPEIWTED